jgi:hypothetical protein
MEQYENYPLQLPIAQKDKADVLAHRDGVTLNRFITLAIEERVARLQLESDIGQRKGAIN